MDSAAAALASARRLAEDLLFPTSLATDVAPVVSRSHLDAIAEAGLYGLFAARGAGGLDLERDAGERVIETLAGGCLTTTFVWIQHQSTAALVSRLDGPLAEQWARPLATGERRSGIAFSHLRRPDPPMLTATPVEDARRGGAPAYRVDGVAPLVTGWGLVDVVHVACRLGDDIVWLLIDGEASEALAATPLSLAAVNASATVALRFSGHVVPETRVTVVQPLRDWLARDALGLRTNGSLALGVAGRALSLLESAAGRAAVALVEGLDDARERLAAATPDEMPDARAQASLLAMDATSALVAEGGGKSVVRDSHAQRLAREAMFLLVQGQTPAIRAAQMERLADRQRRGARQGGEA